MFVAWFLVFIGLLVWLVLLGLCCVFPGRFAAGRWFAGVWVVVMRFLVVGFGYAAVVLLIFRLRVCLVVLVYGCY